MTQPANRTPAAKQEFEQKEQTRSFVRGINALLEGRTNNTYLVTLRANQTITEIDDGRVTVDTQALLIPRTATAALAASLVFAVTTAGKVTINHDSNAALDRTFGLALIGP